MKNIPLKCTYPENTFDQVLISIPDDLVMFEVLVLRSVDTRKRAEPLPLLAKQMPSKAKQLSVVQVWLPFSETDGRTSSNLAQSLGELAQSVFPANAIKSELTYFSYMWYFYTLYAIDIRNSWS